MALNLSEGFGISANFNDYVSYGTWVVTQSAGILTGGIYGDNYFAGEGAYVVIPNPQSQMWLQCIMGGQPITTAQTPTNSYLIFYDALGNGLFSLLFNPNTITGVIQAYSGVFNSGSNALLATSPALTFPTGGAWLLGIEVTFSTTAGTVQVFVNGVSVASLNLTGINTAFNGSLHTCQLVGWGRPGAGQSGNQAMQCLLIGDNTGAAPWNAPPGPRRIQTLRPTSNGPTVQFSPQGLGTNWGNVANSPPVPATDFNESATVGNIDNFSLGTIDPTFTSIFAVNVKAIFAETIAGAHTMETQITSAGTTRASTAFSISTTARQVAQIVETDPATSAAWLSAAVQASNPGYNLTS